MKNINSILTFGAGTILILASCSTSYTAMRGETDDLYFMASDASVATEYAVSNNNPQNFKSLNQVGANEYEQENFSARNVNPEYIAKYQSENNSVGDSGNVYFDESEIQEGSPNVNVYNNYYSNSGSMNRFGGPFGFSPMMGMGFGGFSPWGMGMGMGFGGMSPWGMGGFYDPFWGPSFGMMPGFNMSIGLGMGFGFGNRWMRPGFGYGGFYDPFWGGMGFGRYGMGMGMGGFYPGFGMGRPIIIVPGSDFNNRQIVRGARQSRSAVMAGNGTRINNVAAPSTSRANAMRDASSRRTLTSTPNSRVSSTRDFGSSQNDYYNNSRSRVSSSAAPVTRNIGSPATTGSRVGNSSIVPNNRSIAPNTRTNRSSYGTTNPTRSGNSNPSYNRSASPSYNRSATPSRSVNTPSRSSSPSYSAPSRGSFGGGGASMGGGSRSSGGSSSAGSRGGR